MKKLLLMLVMCAGCSLLSKSEPTVVRYFTPEYSPPAPSVAAARNDGGARIPLGPKSAELRLGRVNAASYLRDKIVFRQLDHEIGYYEDFRWTERPEAYLRRALVHALFEEQGLRQSVSGPGLILEIELHAFDELRSPRRVARVSLTWLLRDERSVFAQDSVAVEHPLRESTDMASVARGLSQALSLAVARVVDAVLLELALLERAKRPEPLGGDAGTSQP
jgi:cholesterol transport system auxiliary component